MKRVTRWALAANLAAWRAILANVTEVEYLTHRLAIYWRLRPRVSQPIPTLRITDAGELEIVLPSDPRHPIDRALEDGFEGTEDLLVQDAATAEALFLRREAERRAATIAKDLENLETRDRAIEMRSRVIDEHRESVQRAHDDAVLHAPEGTDAVSVEPLRQPAIPGRAKIIASWMAVLMLLATDASVAIFPLANAVGFDVTSAVEVQRHPFIVLMLAACAVVTAIASWILLQWAVDTACELARKTEYDPRRMLHLGAVVGAAILGLALVWVIAHMRAETAASANALTAAMGHVAARPTTSATALFVVGLATLAGAVIFHQRATHLLHERRAALLRVATPTPEQAAAARRSAFLADLDARQTDLQQEREMISARVRLLAAEQHAVAQRLREISNREHDAVETFSDDVRAAIARDKYAYRLVAKYRKRVELLAAPAPTPSDPSGGSVVHLPRTRRSA